MLHFLATTFFLGALLAPLAIVSVMLVRERAAILRALRCEALAGTRPAVRAARLRPARAAAPVALRVPARHAAA